MYLFIKEPVSDDDNDKRLTHFKTCAAKGLARVINKFSESVPSPVQQGYINSRGYFRQYIIRDLNNGNKKQLAQFFFSIGLLCTIFFPCIFCVREFFLVFDIHIESGPTHTFGASFGMVTLT